MRDFFLLCCSFLYRAVVAPLFLYTLIVKSQFISQSVHTQKDACSLIPCHATHHISKSWCYKEEQHLYCDLEDITVYRRRCTCSMYVQHIPSTQLSWVKLKLKLVKLVIFSFVVFWIGLWPASRELGDVLNVYISRASLSYLYIHADDFFFCSTTKIFASDIYISYYITFYDRSVACVYVCFVYYYLQLKSVWAWARACIDKVIRWLAGCSST